jgi:hypothetical protein
MVLQFFELVNQFRGKQFGPRAHNLPELYKRRAKFLNGKPHPFVNRGRVRILPWYGKPEPGFSGENFFKPDAKTIFAQYIHDLRIPRDTVNHAYDLDVVILKACFFRHNLGNA